MSDQVQGYGASGKNSPDRIAPQPQAAACHPGDCGREVDSSIGPPMVEPVQFVSKKKVLLPSTETCFLRAVPKRERQGRVDFPAVSDPFAGQQRGVYAKSSLTGFAGRRLPLLQGNHNARRSLHATHACLK